VRATPPDACPNPLAHDLRPSPGAGEQRAGVDQGHDLYRPAAAGPPDRDRVTAPAPSRTTSPCSPPAHTCSPPAMPDVASTRWPARQLPLDGFVASVSGPVDRTHLHHCGRCDGPPRTAATRATVACPRAARHVRMAAAPIICACEPGPPSATALTRWAPSQVERGLPRPCDRAMPEREPVGWLDEVTLAGSDEPVQVVLEERRGNELILRSASPGSARSGS
jgi:hypothetical protein